MLPGELVAGGGETAVHRLDGVLLLGDAALVLLGQLAGLIEAQLGLLQRGLGLGDPTAGRAVLQADQDRAGGDGLAFPHQHFDHPSGLQRIERGDAVFQIDLSEADNHLAAGSGRPGMGFVRRMGRRTAARGVVVENAGEGRATTRAGHDPERSGEGDNS